MVVFGQHQLAFAENLRMRDKGSRGSRLSHPNSRSDPKGGSELSPGARLYTGTLYLFFFFITDTYTKELPPEWGLSKSIHIY